jgi:hypothetical protein
LMIANFSDELPQLRTSTSFDMEVPTCYAWLEIESIRH